ncbi:hypothetical protein MRX96_043159 [Rhipicephalus microplus]
MAGSVALSVPSVLSLQRDGARFTWQQMSPPQACHEPLPRHAPSVCLVGAATDTRPQQPLEGGGFEKCLPDLSDVAVFPSVYAHATLSLWASSRYGEEIVEPARDPGLKESRPKKTRHSCA